MLHLKKWEGKLFLKLLEAVKFGPPKHCTLAYWLIGELIPALCSVSGELLPPCLGRLPLSLFERRRLPID